MPMGTNSNPKDSIQSLKFGWQAEFRTMTRLAQLYSQSQQRLHITARTNRGEQYGFRHGLRNLASGRPQYQSVSTLTARRTITTAKEKSSLP
jgi:hypothetical protein